MAESTHGGVRVVGIESCVESRHAGQSAPRHYARDGHPSARACPGPSLSGRRQAPSRLNRRADLVFTRAKFAVFIDGCYWHGCPAHGTAPKSNADYWSAKIAKNRERDVETNHRLSAAGWLVLRAWGTTTPRRSWVESSMPSAVPHLAGTLSTLSRGIDEFVVYVASKAVRLLPMRIGTWNLAGRWSSGHRGFLEEMRCDVLLLTEVSTRRVAPDDRARDQDLDGTQTLLGGRLVETPADTTP